MIDRELLIKLYKNNERELTEQLQQTPSVVLPIVTQLDARNGYIMRYFVRQVNDKDYVLEVDKKQYENFKSNPRFIVASVKWKIVGKKETVKYNTGTNLFGVEDINRIAVANADLTFGGLRRYITNYLEYWISEN